MIKLEDHIKVVDGVKYVPLEIAEAAVAAALNTDKLGHAVDLIQQSIKDMNNSLNEVLDDD